MIFGGAVRQAMRSSVHGVSKLDKYGLVRTIGDG